MKYSLLAVAITAIMLAACDGKKHPMDKPPPSAMVERESAPNFDELDKDAADTQADRVDGSGSVGEEKK